MPISFACPSCKNQINVGDAAAGRRGKCPHCKEPILVPAASSDPPTATVLQSESWRLPWVAVFCCLLLSYIAGAGTVAWLGRAALFSSQQTDQQAKGEGPDARDNSTSPDASDRAAIIRLIKRNAEDPCNLEIIELSPRKDNYRHVVFRCNQIGRTPQRINSRTGQPIGGTGGAAVKRDSITVEFQPGESRIKLAHLQECFCVWSGSERGPGED